MIIQKNMKSSKQWRKFELKNLSPDSSLFDIESRYLTAGIIIWHIFEDRIFISEGFGKMNGMSQAEIFNFEQSFRAYPECKLREYFKEILDLISTSELLDTTFKTKMPGIEKEFMCSVQLFDREDIGILDLMVICWE